MPLVLLIYILTVMDFHSDKPSCLGCTTKHETEQYYHLTGFRQGSRASRVGSQAERGNQKNNENWTYESARTFAAKAANMNQLLPADKLPGNTGTIT